MSADPTTIIAALFVVLIRKWLQPSGLTQDVERTQGIVQWAGCDTAVPRRDHES